MRKRRTYEEGEKMVLLSYLAAHVFGCVLGYLLGNRLFGKEVINPFLLVLLYVVHVYATALVAAALFSVLDFFRRGLPDRVNALLFMFLSHLVLVGVPLFLYFAFSNWNFGKLFNFGKPIFVYFTLPLGLMFFVLNLVGRAMGYTFVPAEGKAMVQGSQSEVVSSANHKEVKADKPIVWNFADYGKRVVVGQDQAIETIQKVLIANSKLADLGNPRRQRILASFLFVGPTGVGKTETAKALASWLKDYGYDYLRIDANQFSDRESTWTLLGSPKGYIGSDKPGLLPYAISQNPRQVILIDEIEKADQGFYQFLLQMLDEGYVVERSTGNAYYLQRAIVIITSNLENKRIAEIVQMFKDPIQMDIAIRKTLEDAEVWLGGGRTFRITPEFLGRIDAIIPFRSLGFEDLVQIAYRELRGLGLNISQETVYELTQKYYPVAREYGVRYFLKKIQEDVLTQ
ncbi:AAA family ATPase [Thermocrinis sp.]|jgi:energy-coupling factor transporter ATP-binding protein EcfA2|uniref:AAA family ATPase n=1 Tax=Thermocrinis sp. TaxID=2024383 RepID=UPI00262A0BA4|nr:AAA family ATPase [Thermocrinis sp.]